MDNTISVKKEFMSFLRDERGAVTIEWVVLTAGVIALGMRPMVHLKLIQKAPPQFCW